MYKNILMIFVLGHVLGDFYLQTENVAKKKDLELDWVIIHGLSYAGAMFVVAVPFMSTELFVAIVGAAAIHFIIDVLKYEFIRRKKDKTKLLERNIFVLDQILHIASLMFIGYYCVVENVSLNLNLAFQMICDTIGISQELMISWLTAILILHRPVNITIQKLLIVYKPEAQAIGNNRSNNAGRLIGTIERLIMLMLISVGQYSAIGLVLTAKSIARYNRISAEPEFAEYYLLGTLFSVMAAIICAVLFL